MKRFTPFVRVVCIWLAITAGVLIFPCRSPAYAQNTVPVYRLSGADRYHTAAAVSREGWASSEYVVLATGQGDDKFADALAGSPIAYKLGAPILLTGTGELASCTRDEIIRLNAKSAIILGGPGAISIDVENQLNDMGLLVERIGGADRYSTAAAAADRMGMESQLSKVFLTTGDEFQYAMMIAPYASKYGFPILFTERDSLNASALEAMEKWNINEVDIIGGTDTISQHVEDSLKERGMKTARTSGLNLGDLNINIIYNYKMGQDYIAFARNDIFADGLTGVAFAAAKDMNILLTGQSSADAILSGYLNGCSIKCAYILGGYGAVSDYIIPIIRKGDVQSAVTGSTMGNIYNGGFTAVSGGWIYYNNVKIGNMLYKEKPDGSENTHVCSDEAMSINIMGDWIYYVNFSDSSKLYKVKTDGTCRTKLSDDASRNAIVVDNWIYYINRSDRDFPYKISIDGTAKARLYDDSSVFLTPEYDWIYFINTDDGNLIYRVKNDDYSTVQKLNKIHAYSINKLDGRIYYTSKSDGRNIYSIGVDGIEPVRLCGDGAYGINLDGEYIYYSNAADDNKLYKIKTDGTGSSVVYNGSVYLLNIINDWIYFIPDPEGLRLYRIRKDGTGLEEVE